VIPYLNATGFRLDYRAGGATVHRLTR